jgi:hypothetical protein
MIHIDNHDYIILLPKVYQSYMKCQHLLSDMKLLFYLSVTIVNLSGYFIRFNGTVSHLISP